MNKILKLLICLIFLLSCVNDSIEQWVIDKRIEKDLMFKSSEESPLSEIDKKTFNGLNYFPFNPKFRVVADFVKVNQMDTVHILTTKSEYKTFIYEGDLNFEIDHKQFKLRAFRATFYEADHYFVPFTDLTTGNETYSTGRYLEIPFQNSSKQYVVDFNQAYNPWCIYNMLKYNCPIPPDYNKLDIKVEAGELLYKKKLSKRLLSLILILMLFLILFHH